MMRPYHLEATHEGRVRAGLTQFPEGGSPALAGPRNPPEGEPHVLAQTALKPRRGLAVQRLTETPQTQRQPRTDRPERQQIHAEDRLDGQQAVRSPSEDQHPEPNRHRA
jgi:hypothetical protein